MLKRFLAYLVPPVRDEEERKLLVLALNFVLCASAIVWIALMAFYLSRGQFDSTTKTGVPLLAFLAWCLFLVKRGRLTIPRLAYPLLMIVAIPYLASGDQGMHDNVILAYPFTILLGGLFLGRRGVVLLGALSYLDVLLLYRMEKTGLISSVSSPATEPSDLYDIAVMLCASIAVLWAIISSMTKIVSRARASEQEIRRSRNMLAHVLDSIPQSVFWKDIRGIFTGCNGAFAKAVGLGSPEEVIGLADADIACRREDAASHHAAEREVIFTKKPRRHAVEVAKQADGAPCWVDVTRVPLTDDDGVVHGMLGIYEDITERRRTEERLRERDDMIRALVETSRDWIWSIELNGCHTYCNPATESILGYRPEELIGGTSARFVHEEDRAKLAKQLRQSIAGRCGWDNLVLRWRHKDGSWRTLESNAVPMFDLGGSLTGFRGVDRDVTERRQLQEQLLQSQKMEAIGLLAGGVAHDFNNLLQAITGYADLALFHSTSEDRHYHELTQIRLAAERASTLTRQLLAFSRRQVIQPVPVDLNDLIAGLMKMLRRLIGEHIQLEILPSHSLGMVNVDQGQIEQVLMNLCVNARDAMPQGGKLRIETHNVTFERTYVRAHPWAKEGTHVLMSVADSGSGMPPEVLAHIFEPFFTTKGAGEGTGLGLSMVYGIIQQHNGIVQVSSRVGEGTTFNVYLPTCEAEDRPGEDSVPVAATGGSERILLVEDDQAVLELAATILREAGYTVRTASDGVEALALLGDDFDGMDLLLLDVVMPRMGGYELRRQVRNRRPDMRFLFASGYNAEAIHTNFVADENLQLLRKPYTREALLLKVREILDS